MKKSLVAIFVLTLLAGCACHEEPETLCASYRGVLPAADAAGVVTTLTFNNDGHYLARMSYMEKENGIFKEHGQYSIKNNVITTVNAHGNIHYYQMEENQIRHLDAQKEEVKGSLKNHYILKQTAGCVPFGETFE